MTTTNKEPVKTEEAAKATPVAVTERISRLKAAFLYVLIGGLVAATLISVVALLIGQFNSAIVKSLLTIFIFFTHGLLILALLWADRHNQVGKLVLPTSILVLTFSNLITTTLGTWEVISSDTTWRAFGFYFLILGAVFMIAGILRLRLAHQLTQIALFTSIGLTIATVVTLGPWVLQIITDFDPMYYRIVAALSILATASFLIGLILRGIVLGRNHALKASEPAKQPVPSGLMAIYICVGIVTAFVWMTGFTAFVISGVNSANHSQSTYNRYY